MRDTTRDVHAQLRALRLNGMAVAWADLVEQGGDSTLDASRWLVEHLLQAEDADRAMRSIAHQMKSARFPMHRDLAGFNFEVSQVDKALIQKLSDLSFTDDAQNAVLIGGPGTGKTHLATALGIAGLSRHAKRVRFYSTVDLVNALEQEKAQGRAGRIAMSLVRMDLVVLDELGYLPFSQAGGALVPAGEHLRSCRSGHSQIHPGAMGGHLRRALATAGRGPQGRVARPPGVARRRNPGGHAQAGQRQDAPGLPVGLCPGSV